MVAVEAVVVVGVEAFHLFSLDVANPNSHHSPEQNKTNWIIINVS